MSSGYDLIGLAGSMIISAGLVPQVSKVFHTKSAEDISYSFLAMYNIGLSFMVIYGFGEGLWPIYIPCSLELLCAMVLLIMKIAYRKTTTKKEGSALLATDGNV